METGKRALFHYSILEACECLSCNGEQAKSYKVLNRMQSKSKIKNKTKWIQIIIIIIIQNEDMENKTNIIVNKYRARNSERSALI